MNERTTAEMVAWDAKVAAVIAALDQYDESADGEELRSTLATLFGYPVNSK